MLNIHFLQWIVCAVDFLPEHQESAAAENEQWRKQMKLPLVIFVQEGILAMGAAYCKHVLSSHVKEC